MSNAILNADEQRSYAAEFAKSISGNFIDGQWAPSSSSESIRVFDPSTGELLGEVPASTVDDAGAAVAAARAAQRAWAKTPPSARAQALLAVATAVEANFEQMVAL